MKYPKQLRECELHMTPVSLEHFSRHGDTLCCEASDLGPFREGYWWLKRIYNDACDVGIAIRSQKTGREVRFYWDQSLGCNDDYAMGYECFHFKALDTDQPIKTVKIFND